MEDDEDRISKLPPGILGIILSSLRIREAVRTSVISANWRCLWTTPHALIFDAENMLKQEHYPEFLHDTIGLPEHLERMITYQRFLIRVKRTLTFTNNVNQFLCRLDEVHRTQKMKVHFAFSNNRHAVHLNQWISFAIRRNVEQIDLCLFEDHDFSAPKNGDLYVFPCHLLVREGETDNDFKSCLKSLRLAHCMLPRLNSNFSGFSTMKTLNLTEVDLVSSEQMQSLLCNCLNLEWLKLSQCCNIDYLRIEHPFCQKLKYLNVNLCRQLKAIQLKDTNLETLEYKGQRIEFRHHNCPKLRTIFSYV